jgi:hypothetical protein
MNTGDILAKHHSKDQPGKFKYGRWNLVCTGYGRLIKVLQVRWRHLALPVSARSFEGVAVSFIGMVAVENVGLAVESVLSTFL